MASVIQVRIDDDIREKADDLFKSLGTDTTTAIRIFLVQALQVDGFPFEIKRMPSNPMTPLSSVEIENKLALSRKHTVEGKTKPAARMVAEMRTKYGL